MNKNIKSQFNLIISLISLLAIFLIIQGFVQIRLSNEGQASNDLLLDKGIPANGLIITLQEMVLNMRISSTGVVFGMDAEAINEKNDERLKFAMKAQQSLDELKHLEEGETEVLEIIDEMKLNMKRFGNSMDEIKAYMDQDAIIEASTILDTDLPPINQKIAENLKAIQSKLTAQTIQLGEFNREVSDKANKLTRLFSMGTIGLALILVGYCFYLSRRITKSLLSIINELNQSSRIFKTSADSLTQSSQQLAEGANEQASTLEESSASVEEMSSMIQRDAEVARETNLEAKQTSEAAQNGVRIMDDLKHGVEEVSNSARDMEEAIQEIKNSSDSISKIIKTIDEIAFQTNILALNAAVEAARAGEAGAGFAVVADEVRNLAKRAADAAQETSTMIEGSIERSNRGVVVNEQVNKHLEVVLKSAADVADSLSGIVTMADKTKTSMDSLEASSNEQAEGIGQINSAVVQVNEVTQNNAALAEESASTSVEMNDQAETLVGIVDKLVSLVEKRKANSQLENNSSGNAIAMAGHKSERPRLIA